MIVLGTLFVYTYALSDDHMSRREQTMVSSPISILHFLNPLTLLPAQTFTCFVFLDLVSALQNRGLGCGLTQNKMLLTTVSISFLTQLGLIYVPFMQAIFQTASLDFQDLFMLLTLAGISMTLHEGRRRYERSVNADLVFASVMEEMA